MRSRLTALAGVAACSALIVPALAATPAQAATKVDAIDASLTRVNLLNINDFHGRIDGGGVDGVLGKQLACTVETSKKTLGDDSTVLLSAGDNIGASTFASFIAKDEPTIKYLNALQLKASAVGNHEFDQGFGDLTGRVTKLAQFPYLGANVYEKGTTKPALPEYKIVTVNGVRVGVIGAVTKSVPELVSPSGISGLDFGDPVAAVNRVAEKLRKDGLADVIVAEYHEGAASSEVTGTLDAATGANPIFDSLVNGTSPEVDVVFNAHTHALYAYDGKAPGGTRSVTQSQSYGAYVGQIQLGVDPVTKRVKQYAATNVATKTMTDPDATCAGDAEYKEAAGIVNDAVANAKVLGAQVIGNVSGDVTRAYSGGDWTPTYTGGKGDDRQRESTLSNLEAQAWVDAMNVPGRAGADIGIQNPGGVRSDLLYAPSGAEKPGEVTYSEAAAINPFANTLVTVSITGTQLKTLLEQQWQPAGSSRAFLSLGLSKNVTYTFDESRPAGDRITGVFVDGKPVASDTTFKVATNSFLAGGGDNFTVLAEGTGHADSGLIDMDAFITWLKNHGTVKPDFTKHGVEVAGVPASIKTGDQVTFTVSGWDLTSLGSPRNTSATLTLNGVEVPVTIEPTAVTGTPALDGVAKVTFTVTDAMVAGGSGKQIATLASGQTPTKVSVVLNVVGSATPTPTASPTVAPTGTPTGSPTASPTPQPTGTPTASPTAQPTGTPTGSPSAQPTTEPTAQPTTEPTGQPTTEPTGQPTVPAPPQQPDQPNRGVPAHTGDN